jgi:hypothetical protein
MDSPQDIPMEAGCLKAGGVTGGVTPNGTRWGRRRKGVRLREDARRQGLGW